MHDTDAHRAIIDRVTAADPVFWRNPRVVPGDPRTGQAEARRPVEAVEPVRFSLQDMEAAAARWQRFAPLLMRLFPETVAAHGIVESPLRPAPRLAAALAERYHLPRAPRILLKCDNELPIAGSIKARGGVYEVLCYAERVALEAGLLGGSHADVAALQSSYAALADTPARERFSRHTIAVASTGNLGLSVGITGRALGFAVHVHMSHDARAWKKRLLRERGAVVHEHRGDYSAAVAAAREASSAEPDTHFVDDERSAELFLGYSAAAFGLQQQLLHCDSVAAADTLALYLPCGVGGGPGGVAFGIKQLYGGRAHCFFAEPTHAPCFLLGMMQQTANLHVRDWGLDGLTIADGLAVGAPSPLVLPLMQELLDGVYTCDDEDMLRMTALLWETEAVRAEPSAAAALLGPLMAADPVSNDPVHVCWLTGGSLLPDEDFQSLLDQAAGLGAPLSRRLPR